MVEVTDWRQGGEIEGDNHKDPEVTEEQGRVRWEIKTGSQSGWTEKEQEHKLLYPHIH